MKSEDDARLAFFICLLRISIHQQREHGAVNAGGRFNHVRIEALLRLFIEVREVFGRIRIQTLPFFVFRLF